MITGNKSKFPFLPPSGSTPLDIAIQSIMPALVTLIIVFGFFMCWFMIIFYPPNNQSQLSILYLFAGTLGAIMPGVVYPWFNRGKEPNEAQQSVITSAAKTAQTSAETAQTIAKTAQVVAQNAATAAKPEDKKE